MRIFFMMRLFFDKCKKILKFHLTDKSAVIRFLINGTRINTDATDLRGLFVLLETKSWKFIYPTGYIFDFSG